MTVLLIITGVSRALSDKQDADLIPPSGHGSYGLNILKQRRATCSANKEILRWLGSQTPWPDSLVSEAGHVHLQSPALPAAVKCILRAAGKVVVLGHWCDK